MLPLRRLCMLPRLGARYLADNKSSRGQFPVANIHKKDVDEVIDPKEPPTKLSVKDEQAEVSTSCKSCWSTSCHHCLEVVIVADFQAYYLSGVPDEKIEERFVRIYQPTREATQSGLANTKSWKIDFGEKERWENPLIGWSSS